MSNAKKMLQVSALGFVALALTFSAAWAAPVGDEDKHEIHIERKVICDGDDCSDEGGERKVVFIDNDGNKKVIEGDHVWIDAHGNGKHVMKMDGGNRMVKMRMGGHGHKGGFLGVGLTELTPELRTHFGVPENAGVMVSKVVDDSAAQKAGIQVGDIITLVDDEEVASGGALSHTVGGREGGETVVLEIWRGGSVQKLSATLEEREGMNMAFMPKIHMRHGGAGEHGEHMQKRIEIHCDSETEECGSHHGKIDFDCDGADECRVNVQCTDDGCSCTVNGEDADCSDIPGVPHQ